MLFIWDTSYSDIENTRCIFCVFKTSPCLRGQKFPAAHRGYVPGFEQRFRCSGMSCGNHIWFVGFIPLRWLWRPSVFAEFQNEAFGVVLPQRCPLLSYTVSFQGRCFFVLCEFILFFPVSYNRQTIILHVNDVRKGSV